MSTPTTRFQTIPVEGPGLRAGYHSHLIVSHGMVAAITAIEKTATGEHIIDWAQIDNATDETPAVGTIHLPYGATVDCVRAADWAARGDC